MNTNHLGMAIDATDGTHRRQTQVLSASREFAAAEEETRLAQEAAARTRAAMKRPSTAPTLRRSYSAADASAASGFGGPAFLDFSDCRGIAMRCSMEAMGAADYEAHMTKLEELFEFDDG
eukprot:SAG22_NODE_3383_length_1744_cov_2.390881_2_plen_120_part_00